MKQKQILEKLHQQRFICRYTGEPLTPGNTSPDHIIPCADGGTDDPENIAMVTRDVNFAKGAMSLSAFRLMCQRVVNHLGPVGVPMASLQSPEDLSGCEDPVEILTRLGYLKAAASVVETNKKMVWTLKNSAKLKGIGEDGNCKCGQKLGKIAELTKEVAQLQMKRSVLRKDVSALEYANASQA
jgi:hypothetical protein